MCIRTKSTHIISVSCIIMHDSIERVVQIKWTSQYLPFFPSVVQYRKKNFFYRNIPRQILYKSCIFLLSRIISTILRHTMNRLVQELQLSKTIFFRIVFTARFNSWVSASLDVVLFESMIFANSSQIH